MCSSDLTVQKVDPSTVTVENGFVTKADGYTILSNAEVNSAYSAITGLTVPVSETTTVKVQGVKSAFEATRTMVYDKATDSITNTKTGDVYTVQKVGISEYFVNANGNRLPQSWKQNVGLANYSRLLSDGKIAGQFYYEIGRASVGKECRSRWSPYH